MPRRHRLQRYILSDLMTPTAIGALLYTFVLLMNHMFFVAERALSNNLPSSIVLRLLGLGIPQILVFSIPMAVLLGTLIGLGRLSADREWVAIQAAGGSARTLLVPVLVHGGLGALICLCLYNVVIPQANYALRDLNREVIRSGRLAANISPRVFQEVPGGDAIYYVDDIRTDPDFPLVGVILIQPDPDRPTTTQLTLADHGNIYYSAEGRGAMLMDLQQVSSYQFQPDRPESIPISRAGMVAGHRYELPGYLDAGGSPQKMVQDLTLPGLLAEIEKAKAEQRHLETQNTNTGRMMLSSHRIRTGKLELHRRFAIPLASIVFALLALPLGLTTARSGKGAGFAISVIVILLYRVVFISASKAAVTGNLSPWAGAWMANGVILLWAVAALWRMRSTVGHGSGEGWTRVALRSAWIGLRRRLSRGSAPIPEEHEAVSDFAGMAGSTSRFVGRLDRYLSLAYLRTLGLALGSAYLLFVIVNGQGMVNSAMRNDEPLSLVVKYLLYDTPSLLAQVMPIACLVGAVVTITLLSRSSELVAVKAAGVSMRRVTAPILVLTLLMGALAFVLQDRIAPGANRRAEELRTQIRHSAPQTYGVPADGSWRFGDNGKTLYHYRAHDSVDGTYEGLSIFTLDRSRDSGNGEARSGGPRVTEIRYTDRAVATDDGEWELDGGWHRDLGLNEPTVHEAAYRIALDLPQDLREEQRWLGRRSNSQPDQVSVREIRERTEELRNGGYNTTRFEVAFQRRLAQPLAPLVMVLLGLPFGFRVGRRGSLYGIGVALILVLVYWSTFAVFNALGLQALLPPYVAAWTPNVLFGLLGSYMLLYVRT